MSTTDGNGDGDGNSHSPPAPRKLKILMLHGYTQTGPIFHAKTRALEKALLRAFPPTKPGSAPQLPAFPGGVQLLYATGPVRLRAADIPGYERADMNRDGVVADEEDDERRGWWRRDAGGGGGAYVGLADGLGTIFSAMRAAGGVDGVLGFSQGAAAAAAAASLLEGGRQTPLSSLLTPETSTSSTRPRQGPLKFAICYSGFCLAMNGLYEPRIGTPTLHVIGSLDTVVEEGRSEALVRACADARVAYHPGGHFVPIGKDMVAQLVGFIREVCAEKRVGEWRGGGEGVEDIDVPF